MLHRALSVLNAIPASATWKDSYLLDAQLNETAERTPVVEWDGIDVNTTCYYIHSLCRQ